MIFIFKKLLFFLLRLKLIKILFSRLIYCLIYIYNFKQIRVSKKNILILSSYRLRDLNYLKEIKKFNFLILPTKLQYMIFSKYGKFMIEKKNIFFFNKKKIEKELNQIDFYLEELLGYSLYKFNINIVFSAAANYIQDAIFFPLFKKLNIKITIIQRENQSIQKYQSRIQKKFYSNWEPTLADIILTSNETTKNLLQKILFYKNSKILTIGILRMDNYLKKIKNIKIKKIKSRKQILFFSFIRTVGILIQNDLNLLKKNNEIGLVDFFKNSHNLVIDYAYNNPDVDLIIKHKFGGKFLEDIKKNWEQFKNVPLPDNCKLVCDDNPHDLIINSDLVISFNSTTIFESGLKDIPIIIPAFDEVTKKYKKYYNFSELEKHFIIANKKKFIKLIDKNLNNFKISNNLRKGRYKLFNKYVSSTKGNSKKKIIEAINFI
jgi:hypothetical protein